MCFQSGLLGRAPLLALALVLAACGDDAPTEAPSTDLLIERSEDLLGPTDAAASPESIGVGEAPSATPSAPGVSGSAPGAGDTSDPAPSRPGEPTAASGGAATPARPAPNVVQPGAGETLEAAAAASMWTAFRRAVSSRNTSAIARLIADPLLVDGQSVSHADFADRVPGGDVGAFVAGFGGSLTPSEALQPSDRGGFLAVATATTDDGLESALLFRIAPGADGAWKVVEITPAG